MNITKRPFADFVEDLKTNKPFAFSRWGDGEWHAVFGRNSGRNVDGHPYTSALSKDLCAILRSRPPYFIGMQNLAIQIFGSKIDDWLAANNLLDLEWVDAWVFHDASAAGELHKVIEVFKQRPLLLVGPPHLEKLKIVLNIAQFVVVPARDAHNQLQTVLANAVSQLAKMPPDTVVSVSAGMTGNIIVERLFNHRCGAITVIDFGAVWDWYAGRRSRQYMRRAGQPPKLLGG
jgi:hypothetical protein